MTEYEVVIYDDCTVWCINGESHREENDGPAVEYFDGSKEWFLNGVLHRENGPAVEYANGYKEWYINGLEHTEKEFNRIINPPNCPEYLKISQ